MAVERAYIFKDASSLFGAPYTLPTTYLFGNSTQLVSTLM